MAIEIITKEDLHQFRAELLKDIRQLLQPREKQKRWLRSSEVRKLLKISTGTLQNLRINGTLHPVKLPGTRIWYYKTDEVYGLLDKEP